MPTRKLLIVDGTNVLYRAFFAIAGLSTSSGHPTNALFGFIRILHQLRQQWAPTHWLVVFDGGTPAHRLALLPEYKAQRPPMPDDLRRQLEPVNAFLQAARVAAIRVTGQEADDVIATVAVKAAADDAEVMIATSDKDALQLVTDRIEVVSPVQGGVRMSRSEVFLKCGVFPDQVVDWLALTGDTVDNIPGIPGLGPKTAAKLLVEHGTLAKVLEHVDQIKPERFRAVLGANRETLARNAALVRLIRDMPVDVDWEQWLVHAEDPARLISYYEQWEFRALARELREPTLL